MVLLLLWSNDVGDLLFEVVQRSASLGVVSGSDGIVSFGTGRFGAVWLNVRSGPNERVSVDPILGVWANEGWKKKDEGRGED